ncbi:MAG TPA: LysR family transcriptional regulator [Polyangiaceae bacterium]|nr:LysR family transcriptional regulator [Polyangiaceae bacterium]
MEIITNVNLAAFDLNLLLVLHTVLAEGSVARAARRLAVTSSAVSNALARLRVALDDPLTVRSGRGIVPTPRAAALAPVLARTLAALGEAVSGTDLDPAHTEREFTLAIADVGQVVQLPGIVARLATAMPRARLRVVSIDTLHAAGGLASTAVDVSIGAGERGPGVRATALYEERIVLVARREHPLARARVTKRVLEALRHVEVHVSPGKGNRALAASYAAAGLTRDLAVSVPTFTAAAAIVSTTDLVAWLPASLVEVLAPRLGLRVVATPLRPVRTAINLLWHERTDHDPTLRAFRELIERA